MARVNTVIADMINPEVMADMISGKIPNMVRVAPFAKVDTTLEGVAGDTITVPAYGYIGDAQDVAEGVTCDSVKLTTTSTQAKVKKAMKSVDLTDEAVLSGYGNPVGEATSQLGKSIASKVDNDAMDALMGAQVRTDLSTGVISYNNVVDGVDAFGEEFNTDKVMFVNPKQVTQLRKDTNFISADKYQAGVMLTGEIGKIANTRIVSSRKVKSFESGYYLPVAEGTASAKTVVAGTATTGQVALADVLPTLPTAKAGDTVLLSAAKVYVNPIVQLNGEATTEDETAALTIYMKKAVGVETERNTKAAITSATATEHYTVAISNNSRIVLAYNKLA